MTMLEELEIALPETQKRRISLSFWIACLTCVLLGLLRLPFGFSHGDEGFHLASPARYVLGDRLFIDEHFTTPMSFDVFTWPLMAASPFDTVLFWRFCGYVTQLGALALGCAAVGRILPRPIKAALFCGLALYIPFNLPVLFYDNLSQIFLLSAEACFVIAAGIGEERPFASFVITGISAVAFLCSAVCYSPLVALLVFPAIVLWFGRGNSTFRKLVFTWYGCLVAAGCAALSWLLAAYRLSQVAVNLSEKAMFPQYAMPVAQRVLFKLLHHDMWAGFGLCVLFFVPAFALSIMSRKYSLSATVAMAAGMGALLLLFVRRPGTLSPYLTMFNCAGVLLAVSLIAVARIRGIDLLPSWPAIVGLVLNLSATLIVVVSASTVSTDIKQLNVCMWLIWPSVVILAWDLGGRLDANGDGMRVRQIVALMTAGLVLFSAAHLWRWSYGDLPPHQLRAIFHNGKLRGIVSTPEMVKTTEALLASVQRNAPNNTQFLLSYGSFPGLSYLTRTRPALYSSIIGDDQPPDPLLRKWLEEARQHGREPGVIVVAGEMRDSFLLAWLNREYRPADHIGRYVVYVPRDRK